MALHRLYACSVLAGRGLEIGALHRPAWLPDGARAEYADAQSAEDAYAAFPELRGEPLVHVNHIIDLDRDGLAAVGDEQFDFVIFSHVIEHVANPIKVLREIARVLVTGGLLVIAAPDKRFTFDRARPSTGFAHLEAEFEANVVRVAAAHYEDFLRHVHPEIPEGSAHWIAALHQVRTRREHAHVWDSNEFHQFLKSAFDLLQVDARPVMVFPSQAEAGEYYALWQIKRAFPKPVRGQAASSLPASTWPHALMEELRKRSDVPALRHAVEHLQRDVASLNEAVAYVRGERDAALLEQRVLSTSLAALREESQRTEAELQRELELLKAASEVREQHLQGLIHERDGHIHQLLTSRSWRITAPVRWLADLFSEGSNKTH